MRKLMIPISLMVILFLFVPGTANAQDKETTKLTTKSSSVPRDEIDLTGRWTYERDDGRGDKGTFELKRDTSCDAEDGWICYSGEKRSPEVSKTRFWVKAKAVRTELGGPAAPCVGGVNQAGEIVLSCRFLSTSLGTLTAKRDQAGTPKPATPTPQFSEKPIRSTDNSISGDWDVTVSLGSNTFRFKIRITLNDEKAVIDWTAQNGKTTTFIGAWDGNTLTMIREQPNARITDTVTLQGEKLIGDTNVTLKTGSQLNGKWQANRIASQSQQRTEQPVSGKTLNDQLVQAVRAGNVAKVTTLLSAGADPNTRTPNTRYGSSGDTPLLNAAWQGNEEIARVLIEKGADVNADDQTEWHLRPLHLASACGRVPVVELLLTSKGIDVKAADKAGATAWTHAGMAEDDALTQKVRDLLVAKGTPQVAGGAVFQWVLQTPTYACRRNSELKERFQSGYPR